MTAPPAEKKPPLCDYCGKPKDHPIHQSERWKGDPPTHCFTLTTRYPENGTAGS